MVGISCMYEQKTIITIEADIDLEKSHFLDNLHLIVFFVLSFAWYSQQSGQILTTHGQRPKTKKEEEIGNLK